MVEKTERLSVLENVGRKWSSQGRSLTDGLIKVSNIQERHLPNTTEELKIENSEEAFEKLS